MDSNAGQWTVETAEEFLLRDPEGRKVVLPTWKTEALFVMLARAGTSGMAKDDLVERLWPSQASEQASANLRQTVKRLRTAIGDDNLISEWQRLRLAPAVQVRFDESCRLEALEIEPKRSPVKALLQMIDWALDFSPERAIDLLRDNHDIALELTPREAEALASRLSAAIKPESACYGWVVYFRGNAIFQSADYVEVARTFARAAEIAHANGDTQLQHLSEVFLIAIALTHGRTDMARRLTAKRRVTAKDHRFGSAQAIIHAQEGNCAVALDLLQEAVDQASGNPYDLAHAQSVLAIFLATIGHLDKANDLLESLESDPTLSGLPRLRTQLQIARQMLWLRSDQFDALSQISGEMKRNVTLHGGSHTELQVREVSAVGAWRSGDSAAAREEWQRVVALRRALGSRPTAWDRVRLESLPLASKMLNAP